MAYELRGGFWWLVEDKEAEEKANLQKEKMLEIIEDTVKNEKKGGKK